MLATLCILSMLTALTTTVCSDYVGLVDNDAYTGHHADDIHAWYATLAANHPGYAFERYGVGPQHKWAATALLPDAPSMVRGHGGTPVSLDQTCHLPKGHGAARPRLGINVIGEWRPLGISAAQFIQARILCAHAWSAWSLASTRRDSAAWRVVSAVCLSLVC